MIEYHYSLIFSSCLVVLIGKMDVSAGSAEPVVVERLHLGIILLHIT